MIFSVQGTSFHKDWYLVISMRRHTYILMCTPNALRTNWGALGPVWFGANSIFISQHSNLIAQTHYSIPISLTQFSHNSIGSVFGWKFLVVFQFKNSILSKGVRPTKINAQQNAFTPLHIFISLNKTKRLQPGDKRRMQSEKKINK